MSKIGDKLFAVALTARKTVTVQALVATGDLPDYLGDAEDVLLPANVETHGVQSLSVSAFSTEDAAEKAEKWMHAFFPSGEGWTGQQAVVQEVLASQLRNHFFVKWLEEGEKPTALIEKIARLHAGDPEPEDYILTN